MEKTNATMDSRVPIDKAAVMEGFKKLPFAMQTGLVVGLGIRLMQPPNAEATN